MSMIAALYVEKNGAYFGLPGVDPWDEARDARKYAGPHPVVAHPPCQRWGRFWNEEHRANSFECALKLMTDERDSSQAEAKRYRTLRDGGYLDHMVDLHVCDEPRRAEFIDKRVDQYATLQPGDSQAPRAGETA